MIVVAQANVAVGHKPSAAGPVSFFSLLLKFQVDDISNDFKPRRIFSEDYHFEKKGKRAPFSSWAGKRSGEMPIYHEVPEYARWRDLND